MRVVVFAAIVLGATGCSNEPPRPQPVPPKLHYDIAYEATTGGFKGMSLYIDESLGETWVAFRDEREALQKEGFGDPLVPCGQGALGCLKPEGRPPLLSALPPTGFLGGAFRYSARPVTKWAMPCTEITASSERAKTVSIVCEVVGLVQFTYVTGGNPPVEQYELKSWNGLFSHR